MSKNPKLSTLVSGSTSDGFGMVLYNTGSPSWEAAARLVSGEAVSASSRLFVTSEDGLTTIDTSREEFCARPHAEQVLTISADWTLNGLMDGYVLGICKHDGHVAMECYQYGTLDRFETTFLDLLFARFTTLVRSFDRVLLAIDATGSSSEEDWRRVYDGRGDIPETATVVATSLGGFHVGARHLTRSFEGDGMEIWACGTASAG